MLTFAESGHPVFRAGSAIERGELKNKDNDDTIELILRTVISVNQLSVYGAVTDLCKDSARDSSSAGKPAANEPLESMVSPTRRKVRGYSGHPVNLKGGVQGDL